MTDEAEFTMSYGQLEPLLADLVGMEQGAVRTRFRKLRLRPFPDDIQSGVGNRVRYDLRRILALAAAFELNRLFLVQGNAVALVEAVWPEWCRAVLAGAVERKLIAKPFEMSGDDGPILQLGSGSVQIGPKIVVDVRPVVDLDLAALAIRPAIAVDARRTLGKVFQWAEAQGEQMVSGLTAALTTLERTFGWTPPTLFSGDFSHMPRGGSFLDEGPYLTRAMALLRAKPEDFDGQVDPSARLRLESVVRYLERPSPLDAWKARLVMRAEDRPLQFHLICHAQKLDVVGTAVYPWTLGSAAMDHGDILALVESALGTRPYSGAAPIDDI